MLFIKLFNQSIIFLYNKQLEKETDKKKKTSQDCEDNYKKKVVETNNFLEKYYEEKMPKILSVKIKN